MNTTFLFAFLSFVLGAWSWRIQSTVSSAVRSTSVDGVNWWTSFGEVLDYPPYLKLIPSLSWDEYPSGFSRILRDSETSYRHLFLDNLYINQMHGVSREYHSAKVQASFRVKTTSYFLTTPWIDGTLWDPEWKLFRMWHSCIDTTSCHSTSRDGLRWGNTTSLIFSGGAIDRERGAVMALGDGTYVATFYRHSGVQKSIKDHSTKIPSRQGDMKDRRSRLGHMQTFTSPDGLEWNFSGAVTSPAGDASGAFYDPFSQLFVYAIKVNYLSYIRSQFLYFTKDLRDSETWNDTFSNCFAEEMVAPGVNVSNVWIKCLDAGRYSGLTPAPLIDAKDPPYNEELSNLVARELGEETAATPTSVLRLSDAYSFNAFPYESAMVGIVGLNTGELVSRPKRIDPHIVFSTSLPDEDCTVGCYNFRRVPHGQRRPIIAYESAKHWNIASHNILSLPNRTHVFGTVVITPLTDLLREWEWPRSSHIVSSVLRRDGFASLRKNSNATRASVTSTARIASRGYEHLFVNVNMDLSDSGEDQSDSSGLTVSVSLVDLNSRRPNSNRASSDSYNCTISTQASGTAVPVLNLFKDCGVSPGDVYNIQFTWTSPSLALYSFWVTKYATGESGGFQASSRIGERDVPK